MHMAKSLLIIGMSVMLSKVHGVVNTLAGQSGCLRPDLVSIEPDVTSNDPASMPESVTKTRNFEKLRITFQNDCVSSESQAQGYVTSLMAEYPCISQSESNWNSKSIYYVAKSDQWSVFVVINGNDNEDDSSCCIDDDNINYDDYCIGNIDYELMFETNTLLDLECIDDAVSNSFWFLDFIDGIDNENVYSHPDTLTNVENIDVDIFILDTGVRSTHDTFGNTYGGVTHGDSSFGDSDIIRSHGTHVAGIAGGIYGVAKGIKIYEYPVCARSESVAGCADQDISDGLDYVESVILANKNAGTPRRAVINMSFGAFVSQEFLDLYSDELLGPLEDIYDAGGILVASAGNSKLDACLHWPSLSDVVISVGSGTQVGASFFSNYGECVDIYGPGSEIVSSVAFDTSTCEESDSSFAMYSGTSMASPAVTGIVANMLSFNDELTYEEIKEILQQSSDNLKLLNCQSEDDGIDCIQFAMDCETMRDETQFAIFEFDCDDVTNSNICDNATCLCDETANVNCLVCIDGLGCSQCESGYFKIDYNYGCMQCQEAFGDSCMHCVDFLGCNQCSWPSLRAYDDECGLHYCQNE